MFIVPNLRIGGCAIFVALRIIECVFGGRPFEDVHPECAYMFRQKMALWKNMLTT